MQSAGPAHVVFSDAGLCSFFPAGFEISPH